MSAVQLLTEHLALWSSADTDKKSGRGRASGNAASVYGIKKLRELILELALRGKLVPQDARDEPASELLKKIQAEKVKLVAEGKIKKSKSLADITNDEKVFELPNNWEWVRLGNVIDYVNGFAFSSQDFTTQGVGVVKIGDIQSGRISSQSMSRVATSVIANLDERLKVESGDLVIAMSGATTGKLGFNCTEEVFYLNQRVGKIVPFLISRQFLYVDLTTKIAENLNKSFGSAIPNLSTEQINAIVTALPPLAEQHRIVAKVDELMALCDQLENQHSEAIAAHEKLVSYLLDTLTQSKDAADFKESWQRIAVNFETMFSTESSVDALKQTLLQLAIMGKLVPQDASDEPASELLKRIQADKIKLVAEGSTTKKNKSLAIITDDEKPFKLPKCWEWVRVSQIFEVKSGGSFDLAAELNSGQYIYLKVGDMNLPENETAITSSSRFVNPTEKELQGVIPQNSIIFPKRGGAIATNKKRLVISEIFVDLNIMAITVPKTISLSYTFQWLNGIDLATLNTGTSVPQINHKDIDPLCFPLPPFAEQQRIVEKANELMSLCDVLKSRVAAANLLQKKIADVMVDEVLH